jgi:1-acyl-sn-glycerol-3-phosphate acyltransferase
LRFTGAALLRALSYAWRVPATGFAFAAIGLGGLAMSLSLFPLIRLLSREAALRQRRTQAAIRASFRLYIGMLRVLGLMRVETVGAERLGACGGVLVIANHPTLLDVVLLMTLVPNAQCVVKSGLWRNRFLGPVVRAAGYIRNDLSAEELIGRCGEVLRQGNNLILFPEGTRSTPGRPCRFQRGFANLALLVPADLQIVHIACEPLTLTKGVPWYVVPERRAVFRVTVGERVASAPFMRYGSRALSARRLTSTIETRFAVGLS